MTSVDEIEDYILNVLLPSNAYDPWGYLIPQDRRYNTFNELIEEIDNQERIETLKYCYDYIQRHPSKGNGMIYKIYNIISNHIDWTGQSPITLSDDLVVIQCLNRQFDTFKQLYNQLVPARKIEVFNVIYGKLLVNLHHCKTDNWKEYGEYMLCNGDLPDDILSKVIIGPDIQAENMWDDIALGQVKDLDALYNKCHTWCQKYNHIPNDRSHKLLAKINEHRVQHYKDKIERLRTRIHLLQVNNNFLRAK